MSLDAARLICLSVTGPGGRRLPVNVVARPAVMKALSDLIGQEKNISFLAGEDEHWKLAETIECFEHDLRLLKTRLRDLSGGKYRL